jgi:hypothetical protein
MYVAALSPQRRAEDATAIERERRYQVEHEDRRLSSA